MLICDFMSGEMKYFQFGIWSISYNSFHEIFWNKTHCQCYSLCEKRPNTEFFLFLIFPYSDWIRENTDRKKLCIWTLFTQRFYCVHLRQMKYQNEIIRIETSHMRIFDKHKDIRSEDQKLNAFRFPLVRKDISPKGITHLTC